MEVIENTKKKRKGGGKNPRNFKFWGVFDFFSHKGCFLLFFFFLKFINIKRFWHLNHWNWIKIQCSIIFFRNRVILIGFIRASGVPLYIRTWAKNFFFQLFWCFWVQICQKVDFIKMLFRWSLIFSLIDTFFHY